MPAETPANKPINVMILDDHPLVRDGIAAILARRPMYSVCCSASAAPKVLACADGCPPDLAIVDLSLAGGPDFLLIRALRERMPGIGILVLSMHEAAVYAPRVLRAGADAYLMKGSRAEELLDVLDTLAARGAGARASGNPQCDSANSLDAISVDTSVVRQSPDTAGRTRSVQCFPWADDKDDCPGTDPQTFESTGESS